MWRTLLGESVLSHNLLASRGFVFLKNCPVLTRQMNVLGALKGKNKERGEGEECKKVISKITF